MEMNRSKKMTGWMMGALCLMPQGTSAQSRLYEQHFDLQEVELLDGPFKTARDRNIGLLLKYDADRLMTPFVRQAGLPSFENWGLSSWSLEGHVGGLSRHFPWLTLPQKTRRRGTGSRKGSTIASVS